MSDHYQTLGIARDASPEDIKSAYRRLAAKHHPDREGGNKSKFQEIQAAYAVLSDPQQRQQYDSPQHHNMHFEFNGPNGFDFNSIFSMFGTQFQQPNRSGQQRQQHTRMSLWITLQDVAKGGRRPVNVGTQHGTTTIEIEIPLGIDDGANVQYGGIGPGGTDLIVNFRIHNNPKWNRHGLHLQTDQTVSIWDCLIGGEIEITDILGSQIMLLVPPNTQPGSMLRLKNRGLRSRNGEFGDLLVKLIAKLPKDISPALLDLIKQEQLK